MSARVGQVETPASISTFRFVLVDGDHMEPTLRRGDAVFVAPADAFRGEGLYVLDMLGVPNVYRLQADLPGDDLIVLRDNKAYQPPTLPGDPITHAAFEEIVLGKVAAVLRVVDATLFGSISL